MSDIKANILCEITYCCDELTGTEPIKFQFVGEFRNAQDVMRKIKELKEEYPDRKYSITSVF